MPRSDISVSVQAHLEDNTAGKIPRDLIYFFAKNRSTGDIEEVGFWNDLDTVTISVPDPSTGSLVPRVYYGSGALISISAIPQVADLSVRRVQVEMSQVSTAVALALREYDVRRAVVQIHRAFLDPSTRLVIPNPIIRFDGYVNKADIPTPAIGATGSASVDLVSATRELTKTNPAKRSDAQQRLRAGDRLRKYSNTAHTWTASYRWGEK